MTNEELLKEAKRRYPVGTKFKCKHLSCLCEVTIDGKWDIFNIDNKPSVIFYPKEGFGKYAYLEWLSTEWAEIVETPKQEEKSLVGRYVKALVDNPQHTNYKKGEYAKIIEDNSNTVILDRLSYNANISTKCWELMPEEWTPEQENTPQFKVGKWYKVELSNTYNHYLKFKSIDKIKAYLDKGYIEELKKWSIGESINLGEVTNYELVELSEIQPYLPDGHPDKIVKQESNMFKKGDYIVFLDNWFGVLFIKNNCYKVSRNNIQLYVEVDSINQLDSICHKVNFDKSNWRYATSEEIVEYNRIGKPYNVTTLQKKEKPKPDFVNKQEEYKVGDWVLLSNDAAGWGAAPNQINNKILQITAIDLNDNPTLSSKGRYYFGDIRTIGKEIVRKALPHEIPQQSNSILEYVECVKSNNSNEFTVGKIYKLKDDRLTTDYNYYCNETLHPSLKGYYNNYDFKPSTKEAYEAQFSEIPLTPKECISNNDIIEVGDEVEIIKNGSGNCSPNSIGYRFIVKEIYKGEHIYLREFKRKSTGVDISYCKLIKKASQTTTTYEKQVDGVSPQVNTETTTKSNKRDLFEKEEQIKELINTKIIKKQKRPLLV